MAAVSGPADHTARTAATAAPGAAEFRWRRVFPGDPRQLGELRRWLAALLPADPARDDVVSVAVEFATNAIKFSRSGRGGCFAVEITWRGRTVRVAVADGGGRAAPRVTDDPMGEHGRGLVMVRALSARAGVCGDHRGRLAWAEIPWTGEGAVAPRLPAGPRPVSGIPSSRPAGRPDRPCLAPGADPDPHVLEDFNHG